MVFVFDENISYKVAEALSLLEQGDKTTKFTAEVWHILRLAEELKVQKENPKESYKDPEVIKIAGMKKAIIVTQDDDFKRIKQYYSLYKEHNVGVVFFKTVVDSRGYWNMINFFISKWPQLKELVRDKKTPFCFIISKHGISEQHF
jgi:hypothetical protein